MKAECPWLPSFDLPPLWKRLLIRLFGTWQGCGLNLEKKTSWDYIKFRGYVYTLEKPRLGPMI